MSFYPSIVFPQTNILQTTNNADYNIPLKLYDTESKIWSTSPPPTRLPTHKIEIRGQGKNPKLRVSSYFRIYG